MLFFSVTITFFGLNSLINTFQSHLHNTELIMSKLKFSIRLLLHWNLLRVVRNKFYIEVNVFGVRFDV